MDVATILEQSPCLPGCHAYRFARRVAPAAEGCESPVCLRCTLCAGEVVVDCGGSRESRCRPCALAYRARVQLVATQGAIVAGRDSVVMLTLTGPGARAHYREGDVCACTPVGGIDAGKWNAAISPRWNRFLDALRYRLGSCPVKHDHVAAGCRVLVYFRAVEVQRRGVLHEHVLLRWSDGSPLRLSTVGVGRLAELAMHHGYGHRLDWASGEGPAQSARLAAWYAAKYVSKSVDTRDKVFWTRAQGTAEVVDFDTGEVTEVPCRFGTRSYRAWTSARTWGSSMAAVRSAQRAWRVERVPSYPRSVGCVGRGPAVEVMTLAAGPSDTG